MKRLLVIFLALLLGGSLYAQQITNASYCTVAHISKDGTIQDASYHTIGHIRSDGTVQNSSHATVGYAKGIEQKHTAALLFFFGLLR